MNTITGEDLIWAGHQALIKLKQQSRQISLRAIRILSKNSGAYLSPFKGRGMEFDESRPYQAGDDARNLDWRTMARTGKPYTKIFREERERNIMFFLDFRPSMFFATRGIFKSVQVCRACAVLAWAGHKQGDRIGAITFSGDQHDEIRPKQGKQVLLHLIGLISRYSKHKADQIKKEQFNHALLRLRHVSKPGSLIFLISDFRGMDETSQKHLAQLSRHNDLVLIQIYDQLEQQLPQPNTYAVTDGTTDFILNTHQQKGQKAYKALFKQHQQNLENLCLKYRMYFIQATTEDNMVDILGHHLGRKK